MKFNVQGFSHEKKQKLVHPSSESNKFHLKHRKDFYPFDCFTTLHDNQRNFLLNEEKKKKKQKPPEIF